MNRRTDGKIALLSCIGSHFAKKFLLFIRNRSDGFSVFQRQGQRIRNIVIPAKRFVVFGCHGQFDCLPPGTQSKLKRAVFSVVAECQMPCVSVFSVTENQRGLRGSPVEFFFGNECDLRCERLIAFHGPAADVAAACKIVQRLADPLPVDHIIHIPVHGIHGKFMQSCRICKQSGEEEQNRKKELFHDSFLIVIVQYVPGWLS